MSKDSKIKNYFELGLLTLGGSGLIPFAPGTWGSILAFIMVAFIYPPYFLWVLFGLIMVFMPLSVFVIKNHLETAKLPIKDPQYIVVDEAIGLWIALLASHGRWPWMLSALILFRVLDIYKPGLIGTIDSLKGMTPLMRAWLVMADDILAGIITAGILTLGWTLKIIFSY